VPAYSLSRTFRFNDGLARHISRQVQEAYALIGEPRTLKMTGTATETRWGSRAIENARPLTIIARSNLKLFEACLGYLLSGEGPKPRLYFEGDYRSYAFMNTRIAGLIHLQAGRRHKITDPFVRRFASVGEIQSFAEAAQNNTLLGALQLVKRYGAELFHFDRLLKEQLSGRAQADLLFTTTHKAKGRDYECVEMTSEDFMTRQELRQALRQGEPINRSALREEINVYYVAATRAKRSIRLARF
jgi:superfamily I DNA/RNA helicase